MNPTPQQQSIISHPLSPLRVTAGAGTGKTTTMAWRLAAWVGSGDLEPERTLGITFTNKAARELSEGIKTALGDEVGPGREVEVTTYHGFAFSIVREFGPLLGIPRTVRVVTPGHVRQLLHEVIGSEVRLHLDLTRAGWVVDRLLGLSSKLGDHLRSASELRGIGDAEVAPARDEIAGILEAFERRKRQLGVVDYADLVRLAHNIVTEHREVATRIRDRYRLVLLDEYQDTNPGQRQLLLALFGDGFPVTAVGDSDQTIYEWRGASPDNFERFPEHFALGDGTPAPSLELSKSWRSGSRIVTVANAVRAEISKPGPLPALQPRHDAPPGTVVTHWLHSSVAEAAWIAEQACRLHAEEGRDWGDMAVLFRKHRQMSVVRDALSQAGVPVEVASMGGLLDVPEVTDVHTWLRILGRPDDAPALMRILLGSRYRLGLGDLAPLTDWVRAHRRAAEEASIGWALLEAIDCLEEIDGLRPEARQRLDGFRNEYRILLQAAQGLSLVELSRTILDRMAAWSEIEALPDSARLSARLNLFRFLDLAEDWSPLEGGPSLEAFLDHLELLADDDASSDLDTARVSGEDAVALLTVHRAKGLEWSVVFLPALTRGTFPSSVRSYEDPVAHPDVLPHELRLDHHSVSDTGATADERRTALRRVHDDSEWRTAYVAVTRAADMLIATGAWWYTERSAKAPSRLFEIIDGLAEHAPDRSDDPGTPPRSLRVRTEAGPAPDPHFEHGHVAALRAEMATPGHLRSLAAANGVIDQYDAAVEQLDLTLSGLPEPPATPEGGATFKASVTGLVTFATCPLRFRWEHVERLPRRPSPAARRGTELHRRIELYHRGTAAFEYTEAGSPGAGGEGGSSRPPVESIFERFLASRFATAKPILVEAPFELKIGEATVSGRMDAVYAPAPDVWEIVDFKSGRPTALPARRVQLELYAIAAADVTIERLPPPTETIVTFAYLGGDEIVEESETADAAWLAEARHHVEELVDGAASGPHEPKPSDACRHCDFVLFCDVGTSWIEEHA